MPALTALRGVGAAWVFAFHLLLGVAPWPISHGYLGVDMFFILSGFILSHVYLDRLKRFSSSGCKHFLLVRLARIYPLHVVCLGLIALVVVSLPGFAERYPHGQALFSASALIASLLLIQNWFYWPPDCWNNPAWSLSAEWFLYLAFPFLAVALRYVRTPRFALWLGAACLVGLATTLAFRGISLNVTGTPGMLRAGCEFLSGCLVQKAFGLGVRLRHPVALIVALAFIAMTSLTYLHPSFDVLAPFGFSILILIAADRESRVGAWLGIRPLVFLGEISYSLYLIHWIVIQVANWMRIHRYVNSSGVLIDFGIVTVVFVLAIALYFAVERPARAWGRRVAGTTK
jgi:peptidoglycan/LPS O-acetylase OafA/YrhL